MDCSICALKVPTKKIVSCPTCEYKACHGCLKRYFESIPEPTCANCSTILTREFISEHFKTFFKDYKSMRERLLIEREKMLLPETQEIAEREKRARVLEEQQKINAAKLSVLTKSVTELKETMAELNHRILYTRNPDDLRIRRGAATAAPTPSGPKTLFGCPVDGCRGFITSDGHKCGLCGTKLCKKCEQIIPEIAEQPPHECKASDVETVSLVRKETKPCPKCFVSIYKIDGCDQMWCTECKTPFSWITGLEVHERVHNPHFYEWQRKNGGGVAPRVPGDVGVGMRCDGEVQYYYLQRALGKPGCFTSIHQFVGHLRAAVPRPIPTNNLDLRIEYLLGGFSEEIFARKVQQRDKRREKETEIRQIVEVFCQATDDIFRKIVTANSGNKISEESKQNYMGEFEDLKDFVNGQLAIVAKKYASKKKQIVTEGSVNSAGFAISFK